MAYRKKLIEVSLPLDIINENSALETNIRFGHPKTIFPWWARRPLVTCRAILFASLVDDPSQYLSDEKEIINERDRLFSIIENLVKWENLNNEGVLDIARIEISRSLARNLKVDFPVGKLAVQEFINKHLPPIYDPFAGGGAIPLEAQRLGLNVLASDINPIPVLINQVMIQLAPEYVNTPQVNPQTKMQKSLFSSSSSRYSGLAEDIKYYGNWIRDKAWKRIGRLYPTGPNNEVVAAWIWARMIDSPNPSVKSPTPLVGSFWLNQKNKQRAWIEPTIIQGKIEFEVKTGSGNPPEGTINSRGGVCFFSKTPISLDYIRNQGMQGKISYKLMAIITSSKDGKNYYSPDLKHEEIANVLKPDNLPEGEIPKQALGIRVQLYGIENYTDLFSNRQLIALTTFVSLLDEVFKEVIKDSKGDKEYAKLITTWLSFAICRYSDYGSTMTYWDSKGVAVKKTFGLPALQMRWAFPETNPFGDFSGNWTKIVEGIASSVENLPDRIKNKCIFQKDARYISLTEKCIISTDPPYYDNIGYAALSDYFYIWLRKALLPYYPDLLSTILTPKQPELIAEPARHKNKAEAAKYFEAGLEEFFNRAKNYQSHDYPTTIYYAFKQIDVKDTGNIQTGWEVFINSLVKSGFEINGTWPVRTESRGGLRIASRNALASSIVLACRPRIDSVSITKKQFLSELKKELPNALIQLQSSNIAPVDFAQAAIGPGMSVFSRYQSVLESDGSPMRARTALALINQALDEYLSAQEGEYDSDTRWALAWYEQFSHNEAAYGIAETLSKAKNTSVEGLVEAGFLEARSGKVRLLNRDELDPEWNPTTDKRLTVWEAAQHLIQALDKDGEQAAGTLLSQLGALSETIRDLGYRLYTICERKGWSQDALAYNMLVVAWPRLKELAAKQEPVQKKLM